MLLRAVLFRAVLLRFGCCAALFLALAAGFALAGPAPAPRPQWRLEPHMAALYERQLEYSLSPEGHAAGSLLVREGNPPLLLGADLDLRRRALKLPILDTRDLSRHLAFDLAAYENERTRRGEIELQNSMLPLRYEMRFEAPDAEGNQRGKGSLRPRREARAEAEHVDERYLTGDQGQLQGELTLARRFDRARGLVVAFDFSMDLRWTPRSRGKEQGTFPFRWREIWTLREVLSADLPAERARCDELVRAAMARAGAAIMTELGPPVDASMWPAPERARSEGNFSHGANAGVSLLALLHAGHDRREPLLEAAFARLCAQEPSDTWSHAARILALAAAAAPREERAGVAFAREPAPRRLSAEDRARMEASVHSLLRSVQNATEAEPHLWPDDGGRSCSERAHLATRALAEAAWCGIALPAQTWETLVRHWLAARSGTGFACESHDSEASGTAVATALDALQLCRRFLLEQRADRGSEALHQAIDDGLRIGWQWLEEHYTALAQPGPSFYAPVPRYHFHWALLSAAKASGRAELGGRLLAWEARLHYTLALAPSGLWANHDDNAFALLCLDAPPLATETPSSGR